jgi:hypothetical protein
MVGSMSKREKLSTDVSRKDARRDRFERKKKFKQRKREVKYGKVK